MAGGATHAAEMTPVGIRRKADESRRVATTAAGTVASLTGAT